jgi:PAS domain-containing protein
LAPRDPHHPLRWQFIPVQEPSDRSVRWRWREYTQTGNTALESPRSFESLTECMEDARQHGLDPQGRIQTWNAGAERLKGYTRDDIVGRRFSIFYTREVARTPTGNVHARPASACTSSSRSTRRCSCAWSSSATAPRCTEL